MNTQAEGSTVTVDKIERALHAVAANDKRTLRVNTFMQEDGVAEIMDRTGQISVAWTIEYEVDEDFVTVRVLDGTPEDAEQHRYVNGAAQIRHHTDPTDYSRVAAETALSMIA